MSPLSARDVRYLARSPACKQGLCTHVPLLLHDATPDISHLLLVSPSRCRKTLQFRRLFLFSSFFSLSSSFFFFLLRPRCTSARPRASATNGGGLAR